MSADATSQILVVGRQGQAATALAHVAKKRGVPLVCSGRPQLDLLDPLTLNQVLDTLRPRSIINAAAYTDLDRGQTDIDTAFAINQTGPAFLAREAERRNIPLIHMSTDCVFDGREERPYTEADAPNPISVYGASKLSGERAVASECRRHLIARVSWVYSSFGGSFVRTMLRLAEGRDTIRVVSDQIGHPTHSLDIAAALLDMEDAARRPAFEGWGVYHLAADAPVDRASQAAEIFEMSVTMGGQTAAVEPVSTAAFGAAAPRPANARLDASKAISTFGFSFRDWRTGTRETVSAILAETDRPLSS
ncbi:MAG: dTDP-4-dehydrorhamnose reductase [Pseudomonadota bacterium]